MTCETCNGIGLVDKVENGAVYAQEICSTCNGLGYTGEKPVEPKSVIKKVIKKTLWTKTKKK